MEFTAIDVETANADVSTICQIGIARYNAGSLTSEWKTYVDPEDDFDPFNVEIHGIDEVKVKGAPSLPQIADRLFEFLTDQIVVCHTHFDRVAIKSASEKYGLLQPKCSWLDSARVARRTWEQCQFSGYGLSDVCKIIGHEFNHHDALEDAKAAAQIILAAYNVTQIDVAHWLERVRQPISSTIDRIGRAGNPNGILFGEVMVFTGSLGLSRREAAQLAASVGCEVVEGVTKRTTLLVVGDQDVKRLNGHEKSNKQRKAEELIAKGQSIRILRESDFLSLTRLAD